MTLNDLNAASERVLARPFDVEVVADALALATFVRDLLVTSPMTMPRIKGSMIRLAAWNSDLYLGAQEARRIAADLLRAAESAETGGTTTGEGEL